MTRPDDDLPEYVEAATIAARLGVTTRTVHDWRKTRRFPPPRAYLDRHRRPGAPLWDWTEVWRAVQRAGGGAA